MNASRVESRALPVDLSSLPVARDVIRATVAEHDGDPSRGELVVTEMVTNAVRHGSGPIELVVRSGAEPNMLRIEVSDAGAEMPRRVTPVPSQAGGRGLLLIEAVSEEWGVVVGLVGKTVWAVVGTAPGPG